MRHIRFVRRNVDVTLADTALFRSNHGHVDTRPYLGEHDPPWTRPDQTRCVFEHHLRLATEYGDRPRVPLSIRIHSGVRDARAIRRKHRTHLVQVVVRELHGGAVGKDFNVDLARTHESGFASNKGNHAAIGRKCGLAYGIRKLRELNPLGGICGANAERCNLRALTATNTRTSAQTPAIRQRFQSVLCLLDGFASIGDRGESLVRVLLQAAAQ